VFTIYQVINTLDGKSYIGFTSRNKEERWRDHQCRALRGLKTHFHCALRKYGAESFIWNILEEGWDPKIGKDIREPYWISVLKPEYNHTLGGEGTLGLKKTPGCQVGTKNSFFGKTHSNESKARTSFKMKGISKSQEHRRKLTEHNITRAGHYIITDPSGNSTQVNNMSEFCRHNNLVVSGMCAVSQGKRSHHKQWKCRKVTA